MSLSFGKQSAADLLGKAERDLARLRVAESLQHTADMSDALFDLAVAVTSVKDWLKASLGAATAIGSVDVEHLVLRSVALSSFRDIANSGKHKLITHYQPTTADVETLPPSPAIAFLEAAMTGNQLQSHPRLKIVRFDGTRHRAVDLGQDAIGEWRAFMAQHGLL